ncbi:MAG: type I restriction endonuclease subunit S, partial [bacterium]|nr:type I restriction endonuclease subunit S [bacterium]
FKDYVLPKYLFYAIVDTSFQQRFRNNAIGTGVKHLRVGDVEKLTYPLAPIEEQQQIVSELESRLSVCDKLEETVNESLKKAESLRQSILKKAFEGKLVPQEPADEPAHILLQRIQAQKNNTAKLTTKKTRTSK